MVGRVLTKNPIGLRSLSALNGLSRRPPHAFRRPPSRIMRVNSEDEVLARAANLIVGRAAYDTALRLYPRGPD
jgi:hypothetical protein